MGKEIYPRWKSRNVPRSENLLHQVVAHWRPAHVCSVEREEDKWEEHVTLMGCL